MNFKMDLSLLLPKAIAWVEAQQDDILKTGFPLTQEQMIIAREVGVARPLCQYSETPARCYITVEVGGKQDE